MSATRLRKVWEDLFDNSNEVGFLPRKFRLVPVQHSQYLIALQLKASIPQSDPFKPRGWRFHPPQTLGSSGSRFQFVLETVSAELVKLPVQRRDSLGS
jgi:hypothetical protein